MLHTEILHKLFQSFTNVAENINNSIYSKIVFRCLSHFSQFPHWLFFAFLIRFKSENHRMAWVGSSILVKEPVRIRKFSSFLSPSWLNNLSLYGHTFSLMTFLFFWELLSRLVMCEHFFCRVLKVQYNIL